MFDYIKIQNLVVPDTESLRRELDISLAVCPDSGELLKERKETEVKGLLFGFYDKYVSLKGSIHKYHNEGKHNFNDFYVSDVLKVIKELHIEFEINPRTNRINNLEFGVNISVQFNVDKFLLNLIVHNGKYFTVRREKNMTYYEFVHSNHIVKFYNKGKQYRNTHQIQGEIMRFEVKVMRMEYLHSKGVKIEFLEDLLNTSLYSKLGQILSKNYQEILIYDSSVNVEALKPKQREFYRLAENYKYWIELIEAYTDRKDNPKEYRNKRTYYQRKVKEFKDIQRLHTTDNRIKKVGNLITQKWDELTKVTPEIQQLINEYLHSEKCSNLTDYSNTGKSQKCSNLTPCIYGYSATIPKGGESTDNSTPNGLLDDSTELKRYCISCGKDITHQKGNSKFCSSKYVGYVEAHRCRNADSNKRNGLKYKIQRIYSRGVLFEIEPYMALTVN